MRNFFSVDVGRYTQPAAQRREAQKQAFTLREEALMQVLCVWEKQ